MKLNLPKPVAKYLLIALISISVIFLIYTYVRLTNDRVFELAKEQAAENSIKPISTPYIKESIPKAEEQKAQKTNAASASSSTSDLISNRRFVAGKDTHVCMSELNTKVINNDVVKCAHDHYETISD